jgi:hypothetical protein
MYLLNSFMTILSLTLWFLSWESTARLTSGLHGTRFYSPLLLILIFPYPLSLAIFTSPYQHNLPVISLYPVPFFLFPLSVFLFLREREVNVWRLEFSYLSRCWLGKVVKSCVSRVVRVNNEHPVQGVIKRCRLS